MTLLLRHVQGLAQHRRGCAATDPTALVDAAIAVRPLSLPDRGLDPATCREHKPTEDEFSHHIISRFDNRHYPDVPEQL